MGSHSPAVEERAFSPALTTWLGIRSPPQVPGVCVGGPSPVREAKGPCVPGAGFAGVRAVLGDLSQPTSFWGQKGWGARERSYCHMLPLQTPDPQPEWTPVPSRCTPCFGLVGGGRDRALEMPGPLPGSVLCRPQGADTPPFRGCVHAASRGLRFWGSGRGCGSGRRGACLPCAEPGPAGDLPLIVGRDGEGSGAQTRRRSCVCPWRSQEAAWRSLPLYKHAA